jgi:glycosyltransferase involved in cell wall biosynthesis
MKKILIICPYPEDVAPSQRLKFEQYYPFFREAGYELTISPFMSRSFWKVIYKKGHYLQKIWHTLAGYARRSKDLLRAGKYDLVYIHLWVTPLGPPWFERLFRKASKKIIFDIDDLIYLKDMKSNATPLISKLKGGGKPIYLMKKADHVITCTPYLDSFVRKYNPHTTDISSTVDTEQYKVKPGYNLKEEKIVLGWSGSLSTAKYLHILDDVFRRLRQRIDFKLLVIGDGNFRIDGIEVEAYPWSKERELPTLSRFDIGLYPLPDEEWVYGKSSLKAIQYMAMGIPTVATAIGTNFRVIENDVSGILVNNDEEWIEKLIMLATSETTRERIGMRARQRVEEKFSLKANKGIYLKILETVSAG